MKHLMTLQGLLHFVLPDQRPQLQRATRSLALQIHLQRLGPRARITANILKPKHAAGSGCYLRCFLSLGLPNLKCLVQLLSQSLGFVWLLVLV